MAESLQNFFNLLKSNYFSKALSVKNITLKRDYCRSHLDNICILQCGKTVTKIIECYRISVAIGLLGGPKDNIWYYVGFKNPTTISRHFKRVTGFKIQDLKRQIKNGEIKYKTFKDTTLKIIWGNISWDDIKPQSSKKNIQGKTARKTSKENKQGEQARKNEARKNRIDTGSFLKYLY